MKKPEMILFDYGGTLMYEPDFCPSAGNKALYPYISENPYNITEQDFSDYLLNLFDEIRRLRGELIEIHEHLLLRYVIEHFNMKLSIPLEQAERIMMKGISEAVETPHASYMLSELRKMGIRTGVISNLCWSGNALSYRLNNAFSEHKFDFIMTTSEYIFRKPDIHIFDLAIRKSGLLPENIWYCGNDIEVDVFGSHNAGMFPVFYDDRTVTSKIHEKNDIFSIDFPHLRLENWLELVDCLRGM
ncbi:MAG: HAD family hydrolase [Ruminococcus sp.]|nr:HAD family hydrolase [Ruminococcus sp.]